MRLKPIPDEPAVLVNDTVLAIADTHIGIEVELNLAGIFLPSQTGKMIQRLRNIVEETKAEKVVILGDVKHYIPATAALERRDLPLFFEALLKMVKEVHIAVGNHDALIRPYVPKEVKFHPPGGFVIDDIGFAHGHEWPFPSVLRSKSLLMGHNHPAVVMIDDLGGRTFRPAWVRYRFRKHVKGRRSMPREGLLVPSFNELCGGVAVNDLNTRLLGPLVTEKVANLSTANVHLLDGTYLGHLEDLRVDAGLRPRDFRQ